MRVLESWLREWVDPPISLDELCEQLTNLGLEVESTEPVGGDFDRVVVGEIVQVNSHPQSQKLSVCTVKTDDGDYNVVCGAANVRKGMRSAFAPIGAVLPGGVGIKPRNFQGVVSNGMLCSVHELGLGDESSGIMELPQDSPLGTSISEVLNLNDNCIELDLTPNRGDCFSIRGIAREIAAVNELPFVQPQVARADISSKSRVSIELSDPEGCPVYLGQIVENINVNAVVPGWLSRRLNSSGVRSVNAVVDILNYVMIEWGQPMHAFDLDSVENGVVVRNARARERLTLLDDTKTTLGEDVLLITSEDSPIAIAGVIGGRDSGVSESTKSVLLECAFFSPKAIFGTARKYGLQTDASMRYERGVDYELQETALRRATSLMLGIAGGSAGPVVDTRSTTHLPPSKEVKITKKRLATLIGEKIPDEVVQGIFQRLELAPQQSENGWTCQSPSHRFDISIEEDLVEEVCRVYGYSKIGMGIPSTFLSLNPVAKKRGDATDLRTRLKSLGYHEAVTYSFIDRERNAKFAGSNQPPVLQNPISSDREVMRWSLLPGLLDVVSYNVSRQHDHVRVFEFGQCFGYCDMEVLNRERIAGVAWGLRQPEGWGNSRDLVDFFDMKGNLEQLLPEEAIEWRESDKPWLAHGNGADILLRGTEIGSFGRLDSHLQTLFEIEGPLFVFELEAQPLQRSDLRIAQKISSFPRVRRDLALIVDESISLSQVKSEVSDEIGELLTEFTVFDIFRDQRLGTNKKSVGIGLTLQSQNRTLVDTEVNEKIESLVSRLRDQLGAQLR